MNMRPPPSNASEKELDEAIAVLIASTRSKKRPFPLTQIARKLKLSIAMLGSYAAVAERIGLSDKMLRQFSAVTQLSKAVQKLFERRVLDSVDAAVHLAKIPVGSQKLVAEALAAGQIDTSDVRAIAELSKSVNGSMKDLLERVKRSKTQKEYIAEFVIRGGHDETSLLRAFRKQLTRDEILRVEVHGALGRLVLTHKGKETLWRIAKGCGTPVTHIIQKLIS